MNNINKTSPSRSVLRSWTVHGLMAVITITAARANPNNSPCTAVANSSTSTFQIGVPGERDWYYLDFSSDGTFIIESQGTTDTWADLYKAGNLCTSSMNRVAFDDDTGAGDNFKIIGVVGPGKYYLAVRHFSPNGTGPYSLRNSFTPAVPNTTKAAGQVLGLNSTTRPFYIHCGETHWYWLDIPSNGTFSIRSSGTTDTLGELQNATGTVVASNDDSGGNVNFSIAEPSAPVGIE